MDACVQVGIVVDRLLAVLSQASSDALHPGAV